MEDIDLIIAKSILGTLSKEEAGLLSNWRKEQTANEKILRDIFEYTKGKKLEKTSSRPLFKDYIILKQEIQKTLAEEKRSDKRQKRIKLNNQFWYWLTAACILVYFGISFYFEKMGTDEIGSFKNEELITKSTSSGQKISLTLSDGSRIKLNSNTKITFPKIFKDDSIRRIYLDGEAFFEVAKMDKPFIVYSGRVETEVLGTSFNVKKESDNNVHIAVLTGKVNVQNEKTEVVLLPGQLASVSEDTIVKTPFNKEEVIGWKDGILHLSGRDFGKIKEKLEVWYGVKIEISGKVTERGFDGTYYNAPLDRVLEGLSFIGNFDYEIRDKNVYLRVKKNKILMDKE